MDEKYLWPLVGVVLGWLLTFLATNLKDRDARRGRIGRLLSKLILIHDQLRVLMAVTEDFKNHADDWTHYERYRKGISTRHFLEPPDQVDGLREAIDEVSGDYPLHAIKFQGLVDALLKSKKASLQESAKSKELYVKVISMHEVTLDLCDEQLAKQILQLAWMHGPVTYARVKIMLGKSRKLESRNQAFLAKFSEETFGAIKKERQSGRVGDGEALASGTSSGSVLPGSNG